MTSYFEIYQDQEATSTAFHLINPQDRSVLGEISQNTRRHLKVKCIKKTNEYQERITTKTRIVQLISRNKENSFPILKTSAVQSLENLHPVSPIHEILDDDVVQQNYNIDWNISDDSKGSFPFEDTSFNEFTFNPSEENIDDILPVSEYSKEDYDFSFHPIGEDISSDDIEGTNQFSFHPTLEDLSHDEYSKDICKYLRIREGSAMPLWDYMTLQPDVTFSMRATLVDWVVEVGEEYKLNTQTIHLAVSFIDRFLSQMSVDRSKLQLVGTASMFIAAKFEEIHAPALGEFVFITDNSYTKHEVLQMEQLVLQVLDFDVSVPTSHQFLTHYCLMFNMDEKVLHLALYLSELSLLDGGTFLKFPPSVQAASSLALSWHTLGLEAWPDATAAEVGYRVDDLRDCIIGLNRIFVEAPNLDQQAVREKYMATKFSNVAQVCPDDIM